MNIIHGIKEMDNKKRVIGIGIIMFIFILLISLVLNFTFSLGKVNTFYGLKLKDVEIDDITLNDINIIEENGITKYEASVSCKSDKDVRYIKIIFKDKENKEIVTLIGYVGSQITGNELKKIEASTDADLSQTQAIEYETF